jgi:hypothetical protein
MSFFDSIPKPPPEPFKRPRREPWMRPDTVIPGSVPGELMLARTEEVARGGSFRWRRYPPGTNTPGADRRRIATTAGHTMGDPESMTLLENGGGGSDFSWDADFWRPRCRRMVR